MNGLTLGTVLRTVPEFKRCVCVNFGSSFAP
jgi:hypothetical protein